MTVYVERVIDDVRLETQAMLRQFIAEGQAPASSIAVGEARSLGLQFGRDEQAAARYRHFHGWVYASIRPVAQTIAGQPIHVGVERRETPRRGRRMHKAFLPSGLKGISERLEVLDDHPLLDLFRRPNDVMVDWHLKYVTIASLELTGKAHWWLAEEGGRPIIWPVPSSWIRPLHDGAPFTGWSVTPGGSGQPIEVPPEEVVYFYYPDPSDPLGSVSPLQAQMRAVVSDEAIQEAQARAFKNGIWPGLAIIAGEMRDADGRSRGRPQLAREQRQQLYTAIKRHYGGVARYGEPLILDRLIADVKKITHNVQEMDFVDSGKTTKERITQGVGTNPVVMGAIESVNRASAAEAKKHFADFTVNPKVELVSRVMTETLGVIHTRGRDRLHIWIAPYQPEDREQCRQDISVAAKFQSISRNEIRQRLYHLALDPLDNGDDIPAPQNQQLLPIDRPAGGDGASAAAGITGKALLALPAPNGNASAKTAWLKNHRDRERDLVVVVVDLLDEQRLDVLRRLRQMFAKTTHGELVKSRSSEGGLADLLFRPADWYERWREAVQEPLRRTMLTGAYQELVSFERSKAAPTPQDFEAKLSPEVVQAIDAELDTITTRPYWQHIHQTTLHNLRDTLGEAVAQGESLYQMQVRIGDGIGGVLGSQSNTIRAGNIARTETTGCLNAGHYAEQQSLESQGLSLGSEWSATLDQYTRQTHVDLHSVKVGPGQMFDVGGYKAPYPGHHGLPAKERCNCFPAGVEVQGSFVAGTKAWYEGQLAEIITGSGRRLTATPNHPVLTPRGFIAAGELQEGDHVVTYGGQVDATPPAGPACDDEQDGPAKIEQVFETLLAGRAGPRVIEVRRAQPDDFHGDAVGVQGQIEIVRPDRELLQQLEAGGGEEGGDPVLFPDDADLPDERRDGSLGLGFSRINTPATSSPGGGTLLLDPPAIGLKHCPLQPLRVGPATNFDASLDEAAKQDRAGVARFVRELLERYPGQITLDDVIQVRYLDSRCHVYDLQGSDGLIIAQGIITSNCRCTTISVHANDATLQELELAPVGV